MLARTRTQVCRLDHIALTFKDPNAAAARIGAVIGLPVEARVDDWGIESPAIQTGETWLHFLHSGHAAVAGSQHEGLHHLGFVTPELEEMLAACERADLSPQSLAGAKPGVSALDAAKTSGIRVYLTQGDGPAPAPVQSTGSTVDRIDHVGIASADNDAVRAALSGVMQCPIESTQTDAEGRISLESFSSDKYGVVYHTREPEWLGGLRVVFITVGDCDLELLQDMNPVHDGVAASTLANSTRRDQSAISRFIDRRGAGLHHLAFHVHDIDRALGYAAEHGAQLLDTRGRPGSRRAQIAFLHPGSTSSVLLHFVQR
ncbi:MAG: hypothetical protein NVSMB64_04660 [Candidatus Velthaea sp.]